MLSKYLHRQSKAPLFYMTRAGFASSSGAQTPAAVQLLEKDYYKILELPLTSTPEQIKEQYRKLAKKYHPDVRSSEKGADHQPNADLFREVVEAYQVLSVS